LARPAPAVPDNPKIEISGAVARPFGLPLATLAALSRRELTADFHCVAGWYAIDLVWEGVAVETFYPMLIEPSAPRDRSVTHVSLAASTPTSQPRRLRTPWRRTSSSPSASTAVRSTVIMARPPDWSVPASTAT